MISNKLFAVIFLVCIISVRARPSVSVSSSSSSMNTNNGASSSISSVIVNGKYTIVINNGDCIYKQGKIIENDVTRSMTEEETQKMQKHLDGEANLPCFCSGC